MVKLRSDDLTATRLFLLSNVDPLFAIEITDRAFQHPDVVANANALLFGTHVDGALRSLLRRLVAGALDDRFLHDVLNVVEQTCIKIDLAGLAALRRLDSTYEVSEAPLPYNEQFAGVLRATDAACDLLLQPLMAFSNFFNALAGEWPTIAADPGRVLYRTNQSTPFRARIENRIRHELGLSTPLLDALYINVP